MKMKLNFLSVADPGFHSDGGVDTPDGHEFLSNSPKNCMKLKEFGRPGGRPPHAPYIRQCLFHQQYWGYLD